jgi:adenylosuccinate lyase
MGRTHGVHAEPTTFGLKLLGWACELDRDRERARGGLDGVASRSCRAPSRVRQPRPARRGARRRALGLGIETARRRSIARDRARRRC